MIGLILVLKASKSALKYYVFEAGAKDPISQGKVRGIGEDGTGEIWHELTEGKVYTPDLSIPTVEAALASALRMMETNGVPVSSLAAVAHRVVHTADRFTESRLVDDEVIDAINEFALLAPDHNPATIDGIRAAEKLLPNLPNVAVFDTSFFSQLPDATAGYALPAELSDKLRLRKVGFHGPTHSYVANRVSLLLGRHELKQIVVYLGRWASISAIDSGRPIEVSTGITPIDGLPGRTVSGSIDPGIHRYVCEKTGMSIEEFDQLLREGSGLFGMTGQKSMVDVWAAADEGDQQARVGLGILVHRIVSLIAAYHVVLGGAQAISFTGTAGEQDHRLRRAVCDRLEVIGVDLDQNINEKTHSDVRSRIISTPHSAIPVLMIQQREALAIAREACALLEAQAEAVGQEEAE
ncbi:MAG: acetate/propionate family kinase [Propionibacteriaceae bacterium]|jgi:acetate kinase|nr:acetate/propionate family kinase [Propionibacteriaceae bacterium]